MDTPSGAAHRPDPAVHPIRPGGYALTSRRLGALPLISHFAGRIGLDRLLDTRVPADDPRLALKPATVIRDVIMNLRAEHRPLYALSEWAGLHQPGLLGLSGGEAELLNEDRVARTPGRLFLADRSSLLTELMVGVTGKFKAGCSRFRNDSTSISVHGSYDRAGGQEIADVPTPAITWGHSKDHRPDLKQLVLILTVSGDHAVPVIYRVADGNTGVIRGFQDRIVHVPRSGPSRARPRRVLRALSCHLDGADAGSRDGAGVLRACQCAGGLPA